MNKINGFIISYKPKDKHAKVLFHHTVFGRVMKTGYRGKNYAYYRPGILDNIRWYRPHKGQIFVEDIKNIDVSLLEIFGSISIIPGDCEENTLKTGKQYWEDYAVDKNIVILTPKRRRRK